MAVAFFVEKFAFSNGQRKELSARGLAAEVVAELEQVIAEMKGLYGGHVPTLLQYRDALAALQGAFQQCSSALESADDWTLDLLSAEVFPKNGIDIRDLCAALRKYASAAEKMASRIDVKGSSASKENHITTVVADLLTKFGIPLDNKKNGQFVIATALVFEAMGITKKDVRNNVRRALRLIGKV